MKYLENFITGTKVISAGLWQRSCWIVGLQSQSLMTGCLCINYSCLFQQELVTPLSSTFPDAASRGLYLPTVSPTQCRMSHIWDWFHNLSTFALGVPVLDVFPWFSSKEQKHLEDEDHKKPTLFSGLLCTRYFTWVKSQFFRKPNVKSIIIPILHMRKIRLRDLCTLSLSHS